VDSPYDPFVGERRTNGEPERKRVRRSWGNEGRWKLQNQIPSPTKDSTENTWLADAERDSPEPSEPLPLPSPVRPKATSSDIKNPKSQFTQELVDTAGGDTEEDSDLEGHGEVVDDNFVQEEPQEPEEPDEPSLRRSQFAVFRDEPTHTPRPMFTSKPVAMSEKPKTASHTAGIDEPLQLGRDRRPDFLPAVYHDTAAKVDIESVEAEPAASSTEYQNLSHHVEPPLSTLSFGASQVPAPILPSIQTSGYGFGFGQSPSMGPPSALPREPQTPDLRPQQSASLPLPSPFPGDDLETSYMDFLPGSRVPPNLFGSSPSSSATLAPDHLFGFGFGYGSGGLEQNISLAFPDTASHSLNMEGHTSVDGQASGSFPQEGNVTYPQLDLALLSSESYHYDEKRYAIPSDSNIDLSSTQERRSPYPENMPAVLIDRPVDLERTHDPVGLEAYKEFIQEQQEEENQPEKEPGSPYQSNFVANHNSDATMYQTAASEAFIAQPSSPVPQQQVAGSTPSAPIVIDLLSSSESESNSDSDSEVEIEDVQNSVAAVELVEASNSEEEDEDDGSSERLSDGFSEDDSQVASVQDDQDDSGEELSDDTDGRDPDDDPRPTGEEVTPQIPDFDGSFDSPLKTYAAAESIVPVQALPNDQYNTQLEMQSSAPLQPYQTSRQLESDAVDSFGKVILSDGSVTAAPSSGDLGLGVSQRAAPLLLYPELPPTLATEQSKSGSETQDYSITYITQSGMDSNLPITPDASQHPTSQHITQIAEQQSALPPTPQMTQGTFSQPFDSQAATEESASQKLEMEEVKADPVTQVSSGSPIRRSAGTDEIPSIISTWFAPRRMSQGFLSSSPTGDKEISTQMSETQRGDASFPPEQTQIKGLLTPLSYYTPLSNLVTRLNIPASQSYRDPGIDLIAVVSKSSTSPQRTEKGPRDYFTTLSITDTSLWPRSVRVQVFRPWKAALPQAEKGDAVLLRGFDVFSAKGITGFGLRSGEDAAWCVWRFGAVSVDAFDGPREEIRGPPVEVDKEEREHVRELKGWWTELEKEIAAGNDHERFGHGASVLSKAG
jgi:hypothetical protein